DARVLGPGVDRQIEGRSRGKRTLPWKSAQDDNVVPAGKARAKPVARFPDEPELGLWGSSMDLLPELEEMVDVVEGPVGVAVTGGKKVCCHPTDHDAIWPPMGRRICAELRRGRAQAHALRNDDPRCRDAHCLVSSRGPLGGHDVAAAGGSIG